MWRDLHAEVTGIFQDFDEDVFAQLDVRVYELYMRRLAFDRERHAALKAEGGPRYAARLTYWRERPRPALEVRRALDNAWYARAKAEGRPSYARKVKRASVRTPEQLERRRVREAARAAAEGRVFVARGARATRV